MQSESLTHSTQSPFVESTKSGKHLLSGEVHVFDNTVQVLVHLNAGLQDFDVPQVESPGTHSTHIPELHIFGAAQGELSVHSTH